MVGCLVDEVGAQIIDLNKLLAQESKKLKKEPAGAVSAVGVEA